MKPDVMSKSTLIENVCAYCPTTNWGQKNTCSVQNLHSVAEAKVLIPNERKLKKNK